MASTIKLFKVCTKLHIFFCKDEIELKMILLYSFPEPPVLCMQQPDEEQPPQTHYFTAEDIGFNINCPPNTAASGGKCVPVCKSKQHYDQSEVATFEVRISAWV